MHVTSKKTTHVSEDRSRSVLVIGLDGATWELLDPWIADGELPTFGKLIGNGVKGTLWSTFPPVTPVAWTSFATGKNPGNHGIFGFRKDETIVNFQMLKEERIWNLLDQEQKRSCVIQMPLTYPPEKLNGIMVSGSLLKPPSREDFTYPPNLTEEVEELKQLHHLYKKWYNTLGKRTKALIFQICFDEAKCVAGIAKKLIKKEKWDFFFVLFRSTDGLQHFLWNDQRRLLEFYRALDHHMGEIISIFIEHNDGKCSNIFVVSDHGFHSSPERIFNINAWLAKYIPNGKERHKLEYMRNSILFRLNKLIEKTHFYLKLEKIDLFAQFAKYYKSIRERTKNQLARADRTGIFINKELFVDPKTYAYFRDFLVDKLKSLRDEEGETVLSEVYKKEEIYSGKYLEYAPDIVFLASRKYQINQDNAVKRIFQEKNGFSLLHRPGDHFSARNGIFVSYGADIKKGIEIENAKIQDIPATVLHILGARLLKNMDGRVLKEVLKESSVLYERQIRYVEEEHIPRKLEKSRSYSEKEKDEIKRKLKELGYI